MDPGATLQEHVHIPSTKPGHEGYLAFVVDWHAKNLSEVCIVDARTPDEGPDRANQDSDAAALAVHGTWVAEKSA